MNELSMKSDKKLPNLKVPVKGKKGVSKYMRKKLASTAKDDINASVQSADRKPEKYLKPDGKMGIRMVKVDKEVIKKESIDNHPKVKAARKAHAAGTWDGNVDKEGEAVVHINGKPHTVTNRYGPKKQSNPDRFKPFKKKTNEAIKHTHAVVDPAGKVAGMSSNERDAKDIARRHKGKVIKLKKPMSPNKGDMMINRPFKEEIEVDEALTLQQRMKRGRLMKRLKARIKIGRDRARRKMANKKTLEKRSMRQARNQLAKKLTRGIPKRELTFARKQEIEKRLDKPALKARIKRIAKRLFKDVRKKEVQRKKG